MKIKEISIVNFRSVRNLNIKFKSLFGLIGPNSAGKSNILRAINLVLGERYPTENTLSREDFYDEEITNNINIAITFEEEFDNYGEKCKGVILTTVYDSQKEGYTVFLRGLKTDGKPQFNRITNEIRQRFSVVYIPASRNFEYHLMSSSEWSLSGKIKSQLHKSFPRDKILDLESKFESAKVALNHGKFEELENSFKGCFNECILIPI